MKLVLSLSLSLFLVLGSLVFVGVLCDDEGHKGEDIGVKGAEKSLSVDYKKKGLHGTKPSPQPSSPPSTPTATKPSALEQKSVVERGFALGIFEKTTKMVEEAVSVFKKSDGYFNPKERICGAFGKIKEKLGQVVEETKDGLYRAKDRGRIGTQKVKDTGDQMKEPFGRAKDDAHDKERSTTASKAKEALANTKGASEKAKENVAENVPGGEKSVETMKVTGQDIQKGIHSICDERSMKTKLTGFFSELSANFTHLSARGADIFRDTANRIVSRKIMDPTIGAIQLLGLSTAYGIHVWVCFVAREVLAESLPKQQYMKVQSKLCSVYFRALVGGLGSSLLAHCVTSPYFGLNSFQVYITLVSSCLILFNCFKIKPLASKMFFHKIKLEREEMQNREKNEKEVDHVAGHQDVSTTSAPSDVDPNTGANKTGEVTTGNLERRIKNLMALSFAVDVVTLMALTAHVVYVGKAQSIP